MPGTLPEEYPYDSPVSVALHAHFLLPPDGMQVEPTFAGRPNYGQANMQCGYPVSQQDLFYNYYVGTPGCGIPAQLYLCPQPTPPLVGHTYYTYQPLLPHEMLYRHDRTYFRIHPDGTGVKTKVRWR